MAVTLREETPGDRAALREVISAAFGQAEEADLVDRLRQDGDCVLSLVAVEEGRLVGHILLSRMTAPFRALALAPVAIVPDRQGRGIASRLIEAGLARATAEGWQAVFVLGDPAFYRRFGFDPALARGFVSPYAGPNHMVKPLAGPLPAATGEVAYAPAFTDLD